MPDAVRPIVTGLSGSKPGVLALWGGLSLFGCYASSPSQEEPERRCTGDPAIAAVVERVSAVSPPAEGFIRVTLNDGETYLLDTTEPSTSVLVEIIESLRERGNPVHLEYRRGTRVVVDLGLPMEAHVLTITATADGVDVRLLVSEAIHRLQRDQPCYNAFLQELRDSLDRGTSVLVTEDSETVKHSPTALAEGRVSILFAASATETWQLRRQRIDFFTASQRTGG